MCDSKQIRHGLGVRIAGSHPAGPGSIPGAGIESFFLLFFLKDFVVYFTPCVKERSASGVTSHIYEKNPNEKSSIRQICPMKNETISTAT